MRHSTFLIGLLLMGLLLVGCSNAAKKDGGWPDRAAYEGNPLMAEVIADLTIDFVTMLQIRANEQGADDRDPATLRAIDDTFVEARKLQKKAHELQGKGKEGAMYGVNTNFGAGQVLLLDDILYFGPGLELSVAPESRVYLAQHVAPHSSEELFSEPTIDISSLHSPYGAQQYYVGSLRGEEWNKFRTVAIYSKSLDMVIALGQIRGVVK